MTKPSFFLHPFFILALVTLLLNDFYLKYAFSNWLTGKLSDVAGLVVLFVFCRSLFANLKPGFVAIACGLFFCWFKSSLSQPAIDFANTILQLPVIRIIDYSDMAAVLILPPLLRMNPRFFPQPIGHHLLRFSLGMICCFSLCATSMPYRQLFQAHPEMRDTYFHKSFTIKKSANSILNDLSARGIMYRMDSVIYYPVVNRHHLYYRVPLPADSLASWQQVSQATDSVLYVKWEGSPYYIIGQYSLPTANGFQKFYDIRFTLHQHKKGNKTEVTIQTFRQDGLGPFLMDEKLMKAYNKMFEEMFR